MQWLHVGILDGRALRQAVYTEEKAQYMNVQGSAYWEEMYSVGECRLGCRFFLIDH